MTFGDVLGKIREEAHTPHYKGSLFEQLMKRWLLTGYAEHNRIEKVWLWNEFPYRNQLGGTDLGIDRLYIG